MKPLYSMFFALTLLLASGSAALLFPAISLAVTVPQAPSSSSVAPKDYFHSGAGARYLARAKMDLDIESQRDNITVIAGSGGNITVLSGPDGKLLVDAGISPSKEKLQTAFEKLGPEPVRYVVNTHWHWDHTDGDSWLHAAGATIIAHPNTLKHLSESTYVVDWNWTMEPVPAGARPTLLVQAQKNFDFDGTRVEVANLGPGHTDGDLWVYFAKADVLALGDTFWTAGYPFIDNQDGGNIDAAIHWADKAIARTTNRTIVVPVTGRWEHALT